jgi:TPR repeat protein
MPIRLIVLFVSAVSLSGIAIAAEQIYVREYSYQASEADSKISARTMALQEVKRELLGELGTHVSALTKQVSTSNGHSLGTVEIETLSAGVTSVQILDEKWDGKTYVLKAQIKADPAEVLANIHKMLDVENMQKQVIQIAESLKQSKKETDAALAEIALLKKQLSEKQTEASREKLNAAYQKQTDILSINALVESGIKSFNSGDYVDALKLYKRAADEGHAVAQNNVGVMYAEGQGVPQDYAEAVKWYRLASQQGLAIAQKNLGGLYNGGQGVSQNYVEAVKWYRLAAQQGLAEAQYNLGTMYERGQGVSQNYVEAVKWYRLAALQGFAWGQHNLGYMYEEGQGVPQDYAEAVKWYRLASQQGDAVGQNNLGAMYCNGKGVPIDYTKAYLWFNLAAASGQANAIKNLDLATRLMTPAQMVQAQEMVRDCLAKNLEGCN